MDLILSEKAPLFVSLDDYDSKAPTDFEISAAIETDVYKKAYAALDEDPTDTMLDCYNVLYIYISQTANLANGSFIPLKFYKDLMELSQKVQEDVKVNTELEKKMKECYDHFKTMFLKLFDKKLDITQCLQLMLNFYLNSQTSTVKIKSNKKALRKAESVFFSLVNGLPAYFNQYKKQGTLTDVSMRGFYLTILCVIGFVEYLTMLDLTKRGIYLEEIRTARISLAMVFVLRFLYWCKREGQGCAAQKSLGECELILKEKLNKLGIFGNSEDWYVDMDRIYIRKTFKWSAEEWKKGKRDL